jgi:large subunit ribosomal protein L10
MSKYVKGLLKDQFRKAFEEVDSFVVVSTKGIDGNNNNMLRGALKDKGITMKVVKNSMMRKALSELEKEDARSLFDAGPCTVVYGGDGVVDAAKELSSWGKKLKTLEFLGAYLDGEVLDSEAAKGLSKMPSRSELQGEIATLAMSPGRTVAGAISGPGGIIAGCVKGLIDKLEDAA